MASITTAPGLKTIDPIEGLNSYVQNIKPYHTKIFEVSFEYIYTDAVNTTVTDVLDLGIDINQTYYTSTTDPTLIGPVTAGSFWYDPATMTLYIRNTANTAWVVYQTNVLNPNVTGSIDVTATEFFETLVFDWSGNYSYPIVASAGDTISLAGNITTELKTEDLTDISGTPFTIVSFLFDSINNVTVVTLNTTPVAGSTFVVQDVDVTYWYQFTIESVNPIAAQPSQASSAPNIGNPGDTASAQSLSNFVIQQPHPVFFPQQSGTFTLAPTITVQGNATTSVQVGAEFLIQGSGVNDGLYHAIYLQYLPLTNQTLIGVGATTGVPTPALTATGGGMVVPYRFINETQSGSYDSAGYDTQPYDQSAGSIIHQ